MVSNQSLLFHGIVERRDRHPSSRLASSSKIMLPLPSPLLTFLAISTASIWKSLRSRRSCMMTVCEQEADNHWDNEKDSKERIFVWVGKTMMDLLNDDSRWSPL